MNSIPTGKLTPARGSHATTAPGRNAEDEDDNVRLTNADEESAAGDGAEGQPDAAFWQTGKTQDEDDDVWPNSRKRSAATGISPLLAGIEVTMSVEIGSHRLPLRELMDVDPGQLFALDKLTHEPVAILVNGRLFARGEIVAMGDRFGVRISEIVGPELGA